MLQSVEVITIILKSCQEQTKNDNYLKNIKEYDWSI